MRLHAHTAGNADDSIYFGKLFDDNDGLFAETTAHQSEFDVFFVFVAITDQECFAIFEKG